MTHPPAGNDPYGQQPSYDPYAAQPQQPPTYDPYAQSTPPQYGAQQPYAAPYMSPYPAGPVKTNGLAIGALVTGIVSLVIFCCCAFLGIAAGGAGLGMGIAARKQIRLRGEKGDGMALAGIICGSIGIVLGLANAVLGVVMQTKGYGYDWSKFINK